ncbi:MAG: hypothetical protein V4539_03270 [Bacteroidota bacterium]
MKQLFCVLLVFSAVSASAQSSVQDSIAVSSASLNKKNMYILGAWAGANILQGTISASNTKGTEHYFHQMNAYWNIANIAIAGMGLLSIRKQLTGPHSFERNMKEQHQLEKIIVFNGGLDLAYLATGLYLRERGNRLNKDQTTGYGNSLLLQGGFLLIFDIIQYTGHRRNGKLLEESMANWQIGTTQNGVGLSYRF